MLLHRKIGVFRLAWLAAVVAPPFALLPVLADTAWGPIWYVIGMMVPLAGGLIITVALLSYHA